MMMRFVLSATCTAALCCGPAVQAQDFFNFGVVVSDTSGSSADLVVSDKTALRGEVCVGDHCLTAESFDAATLLKFKSNSNHLLFEDTSGTGFPANDWRLSINDNTSFVQGGLARFAIRDETGGKDLLTLMAGAPAHALWVDGTGQIGVGTSLPQSTVHLKSDSTAAVRLDSSDTSSWQISAPGAFEISDLNTPSTPFSLASAAPSGSFTIDAQGQVGLGTSTPQELLHIQTTATGSDAFALFDAAGADADAAFRLRQQGTVPTTWEFRNQQSSGRLNVGIAGGNTPLKIDDAAQNNLLKLGTNSAPDAVVITGRLVVNNTALNVPDYVFEDSYALRPLSDVKTYIDTHAHLPDVPSAAQIAQRGIDLSEMQMTLLKKIEELTLYALEQDRLIAAQTAALAEAESRHRATARAQEGRIARLEALVRAQDSTR